MTNDNQNQNQIISYLNLRLLIGLLGFFLPLFLVIFDSISKGIFHIEYSISDYYNNGSAGDLFVGVLFVLGFFLLSYKGYEKIDDRIADIGCIGAIGVALFPTTSENNFVHMMHFVFAMILFTVFIIFSLYLFRKTSMDKEIGRQKKNRNKVYATCGIIMILCILGIIISMQQPLEELSKRCSLVFWFETIALIAFGFSWIVKGEYFWKDKKEPLSKTN